MVLIWDMQFGLGEIIWGLKFRDPKCAICGLKIWGRQDYLESGISSLSLSKPFSVSF